MNKNIIKIGNKKISEDSPVFIIAEAGVNHNGKLSLALKLVDAAKEAGADAIKFQTFCPDETTPKSLQKVSYQKKGSGAKETMYEMLKRLELNLEEFSKIKKHCDREKIIFLSTASDPKSLEIVEKVGVNAFKIGSGDLTYIPFIEEVAKRQKPMIISTGMATLAEVKDAVNAVKKQGNKKLILLQCTTAYPAKFQDINLNVLRTLKRKFGCIVGFSDHTPGIEASIAAVALGAKVIEKHFTLDKKMKGPDHRASLEPSEFKAMIKTIRNVESAMGFSVKKPTKAEIEIAKKIRKSVVAARNLEKGEILDKTNTKIMKLEGGTKPKDWDKVIGKRIKRNKSAYELILEKDII